MNGLNMGNSNTLATWCEELTHWKRPCCWERLRAGGEGDDRDEMVGCHHRLNGHEFGQTPGVGDGQGGLVCCSSWGRKESDMTEQLNWTEAISVLFFFFFNLIYLGCTWSYLRHMGPSSCGMCWLWHAESSVMYSYRLSCQDVQVSLFLPCRTRGR